MAAVGLEQVTKVYPDGTKAVDGLDLPIADGEFMVLVGPSGCGKTSALRMVAGLEEISAGVIRIGDRIVNDLDCGERDIAMVFQNYALYPHMTVAGNLRFPLKRAGLSRAEQDARIQRTARMLSVEAHLDRKPARLSGGQRQRVAMGRALVREPQVFLMDEPLSNLDAKLRMQMRTEIAALQRSVGITTIYVTHDQIEALTMGDRIAVMRGGLLQQVCDPQTLYGRPANLFVAAFIGAPAMNLIDGELAARDGRPTLRLGTQHLALDARDAPSDPTLRSVVFGVRPENMRIVTEPEPGRTLAGVVQTRESVGSDLLLTIALDGIPPLSTTTIELAQLADDRSDTNLARSRRHACIVVRVPPDVTHRPNDPVSVSIADGAGRLFDSKSGRAIGTVSSTPAGSPPSRQSDGANQSPSLLPKHKEHHHA